MKKLLIIVTAFFAALAISSCDKNNLDITNTLTLGKKVYKVDFGAYVDKDGRYDSDIHFLEESELEQAWGMMWAVGKVGTYSLPANEEDFILTKNTYPNYNIEFKSGTSTSWIEDKRVCLVVDGVLTDGTKFRLSVKSENESQ